MKNPFNTGAVKTHTYTVTLEDIAKFESGTVHEVFSTFALAREAEWSGRLFVLEMKEAGEEGIGSGLNVTHISPAFVGQEVIFTATLAEVNKNEVVTDYKATVNDRVIAEGRQWQKIVNKEKLDRVFEQLK